MSTVPSRVMPAANNSADPIFRQIRDLVYKVAGIFQLD